MIYVRVSLAFLGSLLLVFCAVRILWEFVRWAVMTISEQSPPFVGVDPRIPYRIEAVVLAAGLTLLFLAWILR